MILNIDNLTVEEDLSGLGYTISDGTSTMYVLDIKEIGQVLERMNISVSIAEKNEEYTRDLRNIALKELEDVNSNFDLRRCNSCGLISVIPVELCPNCGGAYPQCFNAGLSSELLLIQPRIPEEIDYNSLKVS